jgi:hypothetical protein
MREGAGNIALVTGMPASTEAPAKRIYPARTEHTAGSNGYLHDSTQLQGFTCRSVLKHLAHPDFVKCALFLTVNCCCYMQRALR